MEKKEMPNKAYEEAKAFIRSIQEQKNVNTYYIATIFGCSRARISLFLNKREMPGLTDKILAFKNSISSIESIGKEPLTKFS